VRHLTYIMLMPLLAACGAFTIENVPATLEVEMTTYATEAIAINEAIFIEQTRVAATVAAAQSEIQNLDNRNAVILATVQAGTRPTQAVAPVIIQNMEDGVAEMDMMTEDEAIGDSDDSAGRMQFTEVTTAGSVRQTDGCASSPQTLFNPAAERIYMTTRAINLRTGTQLSVDWFYDNELVFQQSWTAPRDARSLCIWLYIEPQDVPFSAGEWRATLYADGNAIDSSTFSIMES